MGFDPKAYAAEPAPPPAAAPSGFDPRAYAGPAPAEPPPASKPPVDEVPSLAQQAIATFGNGASFGFGPILGAAGDYAYDALTGQRKGVPFSAYREGRANILDKARTEHPVLAGLAEATGGTVASLALPEAGLLRTLGPVRGAITAGAGYGATTGAGEALSHGKSVGEAAQEAAGGAVVGGVTAGTLAGGAQALTRGAPARVAKAVGKGLSEPERVAVADLAVKDPEIAEALTHGPHDGALITKKRIEAMGQELAPHLDNLDRQATAALGDYRAPGGGGGFKSQEFFDALDARIAAEDKIPRNDAITGELKRARANLAERWNKGVLIGADGAPVRNVENIATAVTPTRELADLARRETNPGVREFLDGYLNKHLDAIAGEAGPGSATVSAIRGLTKDIETAGLVHDRLEGRAARPAPPFKLSVGALTHGVTGHLGEKAAEAGTRKTLDLLRREGDSASAAFVLSLIEKGIPIKTALAMSQQERPGGAAGSLTRPAGEAAVDIAKQIFGAGH